MDKNGVKSREAELLIELEQIADVVEREMNPITAEEMGLVKTKKAAIFLRDPYARMIARDVAKIYHGLVPPHPLILSKNINREAPACALLFH